MKGSVRGEAILRHQREFLRAPVDEAKGRAVAVHDALRLARRSRGVENVGERSVHRRFRTFDGTSHHYKWQIQSLQHGTSKIAECQAVLVWRSQLGGARAIGDDSADRAINENVPVPLHWRMGINRHVGRPTFKNAKY